MSKTCLKFTANQKTPLALRRLVTKRFIPLDEADYQIEIQGVSCQGRKNNYKVWMAYCGQHNVRLQNGRVVVSNS